MKIVKKIEYLFVLLITLWLISPGISKFCAPYRGVDFDTQNFLVWDYALLKGLIPYKEFFSIYGSLFLYKNVSYPYFLVFIASSVLLFMILYILLKKVTGSFLRSFVAYFFLILLVTNVIGVLVFARYGIVIAAVGLYSLIISKYGLTKKKFMCAGAIAGIILSLVTDQGIYMAFMFGISLVFLLPKRIKGSLHLNIRMFAEYALIFLIGLCIGFLPHFIFLLQAGLFVSYCISLYKLFTISIFAKIPFLPYVGTKENLLILATVFVSFNLMIRQWLAGKTKMSFELLLQALFTILIIVFEQKNIVRPNVAQLVLLVYLLFLLFARQVTDYLESIKIREPFVTILYVLVFIFLMRFFDPWFSTQSFRKLDTPDIFMSKLIDVNVSQCKKDLLAPDTLLLDQSVVSVAKRLQHYRNTNKVFSFPNDPIFYALLNSNVPPYFNLYNSSLEDEQQANIDYMKRNNTEVVVINTSIPKFDDVPVYIRGLTIMKYILREFAPIDRIGNFLILTKKDKVDIFTEVTPYEEFARELKYIDLGSIPASEGFNKWNLLLSLAYGKSTVSSQKKLDAFVALGKLQSDRTVLAIFSGVQNQNRITVAFRTDDAASGSAVFNSCPAPKPCLLHLSSMPIFYRNRRVSEISVDNAFERIMILETSLPAEKLLW